MTTSADDADPLAGATVASANLYLAREACERYLPGIESVALLSRDAQLLILPLTRESGGGLLLKIRNARGDRVIHAQEFFRVHGYAETPAPQRVAMHWDGDAAALVLSGVPREAGGVHTFFTK